MILPIEGDEASGWKPGKPTVFLNSPFERARADVLARRAVAGLRIERVRTRMKSMSGRFRDRAASGRSRPAAARMPTWSRARRELFYVTPDQHGSWSRSYTVDGDSFRADKPRALVGEALQCRR